MTAARHISRRKLLFVAAGVVALGASGWLIHKGYERYRLVSTFDTVFAEVEKAYPAAKYGHPAHYACGETNLGCSKARQFTIAKGSLTDPGAISRLPALHSFVKNTQTASDDTLGNTFTRNGMHCYMYVFLDKNPYGPGLSYGCEPYQDFLDMSGG